MYFDQVAFGSRLKELRKENGFSQEELAEKLNVSTKHYGHLEQGRKGCSVDFLLELADFFHVSTDYLLLGRSHDREAEVARLKAVIASLNQLVQEM